MVTPIRYVRAITDSDGAVLLNCAANQITALNAMGGFIWRLLEEGLDEIQIVGRIVDETRADRMLIDRDVADFLHDLGARGLLRIGRSDDRRNSYDDILRD